MEACQRNIYGEVVPETCMALTVCIVIDSSGMMGGYLPADIETAVNSFFKIIGASKDADDLIEICVYESHDEVEFLGGFGKASTFVLSDLRYGGSWNLPTAIVQAMEDLIEYSLVLDRRGRLHATPVMIVLSDNPVSQDRSLYQSLDEFVLSNSHAPDRIPRCVFVSGLAGNDFNHHLPVIEFRQAERGALSLCMQTIARELTDMVRPHQIPRRSSRGKNLVESEVLR